MAHELANVGALRGISGELYGYLFENKEQGIDRGVFWNLIIRCAPIAYLGDEWEPSILFDWLTTDSLTARTLSSESQGSVEASFYIVTHDPAYAWTLQFEHDGNGMPCRGRFELSVEFAGLSNDPHPNLRIVGSSPVQLTWLGVQRNNFFPKPSSDDDARAMLEPYFPEIREWVPLAEEDEDGWPVADPQSFRFVRKDASIKRQ